MYIGSTNLALDLPEYKTSVSPNWITSEKYYNCEYFYYHMNHTQKKRSLFNRKKADKNN